MTTTAATNTNAQEALSAQKAVILCDLDAIQTATGRYVAACNQNGVRIDWNQITDFARASEQLKQALQALDLETVELAIPAEA